MLQVNGRLVNTEVARALDVTETTVRKRIAHLLDEKLMAIVAVPSPEAAGATLSAIMGVSVDLPAWGGGRDDQDLPGGPLRGAVGRPVRAAGRGVLRRPGAPARLRDPAARRRCPGVTNLETSIILKVVKFSYEWEIA